MVHGLRRASRESALKTFQHQQIDLKVSSVVLGLMRIARMDDSGIRELVDPSIDAGITVFDHADVYGPERHFCEKRFGEAVTFAPGDRERILIQSKVGIRKGYFDFSEDHILKSVDGSLAALKTD